MNHRAILLLYYMRNDKKVATELRKFGKSYNQISQKLRIPRSTLSDWFGGSGWSQKIRKELESVARIDHKIRIEKLNKIRGENLKKLYLQAKQEAVGDFEKLKYHPLFIAGVMLYWGEGDKASRHRVALANTDPKMIKIFTVFLQDICKVDKKRLKIWLLLYPDLKEEECKKYWKEYAGLKNFTFNKSIVVTGRHKTKRLHHGVCTVFVSSRYLKEKMIIWLALFSDVILEKEYY